MKTVYLAGPIFGCTDAQANDWRQRVKDELAGRATFLDPMDRDYRGQEDANVEEIVDGDKHDIRGSDIVLANTLVASAGTAMEVMYAHQLGALVIAVVASRISPWVRYHSHYQASSIEEAIQILTVCL